MKAKKMIIRLDDFDFEEITENDVCYCFSLWQIKGDYKKEEDEKWLKFCKEHNFDSRNTNGKYYDLYLRMCAEGLL